MPCSGATCLLFSLSRMLFWLKPPGANIVLGLALKSYARLPEPQLDVVVVVFIYAVLLPIHGIFVFLHRLS